MTLNDIIRHTCSELEACRFHCGACGIDFHCDLQPSYCPECGIKFMQYFYVPGIQELLSAGKA